MKEREGKRRERIRNQETQREREMKDVRKEERKGGTKNMEEQIFYFKADVMKSFFLFFPSNANEYLENFQWTMMKGL